MNNHVKKQATDFKDITIKDTKNKARFCIVDNKELILMVSDDNDTHPAYDAGIWVSTPLAKEIVSIHEKN